MRYKKRMAVSFGHCLRLDSTSFSLSGIYVLGE